MIDVSEHHLESFDDGYGPYVGCHTCGWHETGEATGRPAARRHGAFAEKLLGTTGVANAGKR